MIDIKKRSIGTKLIIFLFVFNIYSMVSGQSNIANIDSRVFTALSVVAKDMIAKGEDIKYFSAKIYEYPYVFEIQMNFDFEINGFGLRIDSIKSTGYVYTITKGDYLLTGCKINKPTDPKDIKIIEGHPFE